MLVSIKLSQFNIISLKKICDSRWFRGCCFVYADSMMSSLFGDKAFLIFVIVKKTAFEGQGFSDGFNQLLIMIRCGAGECTQFSL